MSQLIIIRTHEWNSQVNFLYKRITNETNMEVVVVSDSTTKRGIFPDEIPVIHVDENLLRSLELPVYNKVMYYAGDYNFYIAKLHFPNHKKYWLIEPDVYINFSSLSNFFNLFDSNDDTDLIVARFAKATPQWWWHKNAQHFFTDVYQCIYSLVRLSSLAIDNLLEMRQHLYDGTTITPADQVVNDESFTASGCAAFGLNCKNLNDFGKQVYTTSSFNFVNPFSFKIVRDSPKDGLIYHPTLQSHHYVHKLQRLLGDAKAHGKLDDFKSFFIDKCYAGMLVEARPDSVERFIERCNDVFLQANLLPFDTNLLRK
jgi:hypothetical protein